MWCFKLVFEYFGRMLKNHACLCLHIRCMFIVALKIISNAFAAGVLSSLTLEPDEIFSSGRQPLTGFFHLLTVVFLLLVPELLFGLSST